MPLFYSFAPLPFLLFNELFYVFSHQPYVPRTRSYMVSTHACKHIELRLPINPVLAVVESRLARRLFWIKTREPRSEMSVCMYRVVTVGVITAGSIHVERDGRPNGYVGALGELWISIRCGVAHRSWAHPRDS